MTAMSVPSVAPPRGAFSALGEISPTREEFRELAGDRRVIPVTRRLLADAHHPGRAVRDAGRRSARHVPAGIRGERPLLVALVVRRGGRAGRAHRAGRRGALARSRRRSGCRTGGDPLHVLAETLRLLHTEPLAGLPPLTGGMVGYLGYDIVRRLERIGASTRTATRPAPSTSWASRSW